jgi:hypothetical protein
LDGRDGVADEPGLLVGGELLAEELAGDPDGELPRPLGDGRERLVPREIDCRVASASRRASSSMPRTSSAASASRRS